MFKWLRGLRDETKPIAADANRMVAKSSERGEPPCGIDARATMLVLIEQARAAPARVKAMNAERSGGKIMRLLPMCFPIKVSGKRRAADVHLTD